MKKITLCFFTILFFSYFSYAQSNNVIEKIPNEIYKKIKIPKPSSDLINKLGKSGLDLDCGVQLDSNGDLLIEVSSYEEAKIKKLTFYQVVIADMEKFYSKRAIKNLPVAKSTLRLLKLKKLTNKNSSLKATTYGNITHRFENTEIDWAVPTNYQLGASFGGCLTVDETYAQLDLMHTLYPNLITIKSNTSPTNQLTTGGRPIYVVEISNSAVSGTKPETLYTGMTHSREVASLMNLTYYMWYLLENYATDSDVKNLVDNHALYFIPIVNPDGLAFNQLQSPSGGGMQRKNRRETGACTTYLDGIDLNRNWGTYWGYDNTGSSPNGCDDTYRGTGGFSEAETNSIKEFFLLHDFKTSINHHAYKNAVLHGRAAFYRTDNIETNSGVKTGRENEYYQYSHDMTQYNRYAYGSSPNISYWNNGNCNDWMSGGSGKSTLCWTPENGAQGESTAAYLNNGFWPDPVNITAISKRAMRMNFIAGFYSGTYAKLHDLSKSDITSTSGSLNFGLERVGQTVGDFTVTVTPISSNIISVSNVGIQTGMTILEQRNLNVGFVLNSSIAAKEKIVFEVTLTNGKYIIYKTRLEKYYNPTALFTAAANPTSITSSGWTASPTTGGWSVTSDGFGATNGITASTTVPYANALTTTNLTQTTPISLVGKQQIVIQFDTKWDLERSFDYVELQGSIDGTTWIPMKGKYTKPGSTLATNDYSTTLTSTSKTSTDKGFQPDGEPLYDGNKSNKWLLEEFFINNTENSGLFNKANVRFRFILRTDSNNRDHGYNTTFTGFTFDNFKILEIKSSPPVAACKDAILTLSSAGSVTVLTSDVNNGSTDDIGITTVTVSPNTFNCTHANTIQNVTLTVQDADGQTSTCTSNVTIKDVTPPVIPTLANVTAQCSATPNAPTTTDVCKGTITGTTATTFPITTQGTTIVTWTFNDGNGQAITANQNVIIDDTTAPLSPLLADLTGQCEVTPTAPATSDLCAGTITGTTTTTFPIMAPGTTVVTWNFNDGNGQSINVNQNVIIESTTWNGSSWSNGIPNATKHLIISGNYTPAADVAACNLTVNNNAVVFVNSGINVNISTDVTVAPGSSLTFENNANLLQTKNTNGNFGNINVKRKTSDLKLLDYVLWSSPVSGQQLQPFSSATLSNRFYTYNSSTNLYNTIVPTNNFVSGIGYLIRMPNNHPTLPTIWEGQFQGVPNNGNYNITVTNNAYHAIGNPYPSSINANTFISTNNITEALYFWRKTNNTATSSYASYTTAGGTANAGGLSSIVPNGIIQVGQGFVAKATGTTILFTNAMRVANNANQFLRIKETELHRIWLNLSKDATPINQMLIAYMPKATSGMDATIDGRYINDNATALNSLIENEEFVIQGRSLPFKDTDVVPLTFKTNAAGTFTIAIDHVDGLFANKQDILLKDNITGIEQDIKAAAYSFQSPSGTFNTRFQIIYRSSISLEIKKSVFDENSIIVFKQNGNLTIDAGKTILKTVRVFDIRGRLILEQENVNDSTTVLKNLNIGEQTLLIQITSDENKMVIKKAIY